MTISLDFNDAGPTFPALGDKASTAVEIATGFLADCPGSARSTHAAWLAVRASLSALATKADCDRKTMKALAEICAVVNNIEAPYASKAKTETRKAGRPPKVKNLERQAAAVFAVEWLHALKPPLSGRAANQQVAAYACVTPNQLRQWKKDFGRKKSTPREPNFVQLHRRASNNVRYEVWEEFTCSWREIEGYRLNTARRNNPGAEQEPKELPVYGELKERHPEDATQEQVLDWLRRRLAD